MTKPSFRNRPGTGALHPVDQARYANLAQGPAIPAPRPVKNPAAIAVSPGASQGGAFTLSVNAPLYMNNGALDIFRADSGQDGALTVDDWTTFNAKMTNPMTTAGDIIYGGASGLPTRLPIGTNGYTLQVVAGLPAWQPAAGGSGQPLYPVLTPPPTGSMTWLNQGAATITTTSRGFGALRVPAAAGDIVHGLYQAAPAPPYTMTMGFFISGVVSTSRQAGLMLYDSASGKLRLFYVRASNLIELSSWNNPTSPVSVIAGPVTLFIGGVYWLRFVDDGTNRFYSYSSDGEDWVQFYTEVSGTYLTPDSVGFYADTSDTNSDVVITALHFSIV